MEVNILVVDDEPEIADLVSVYLRGEGFTVFACGTGADALDVLRKEKIDLAVLDVMLPDISGMTLCAEIRRTKQFPILMLTAKTGDMDKINGLTIALESGAAPELVTYVKNRTTGSSLTIDLVNDEKVAETFASYFPAGKNISGKTEAVLDFSFMFANRYDFSPSTNVFTITATDGNGKQTVVQVKFKK